MKKIKIILFFLIVCLLLFTALLLIFPHKNCSQGYCAFCDQDVVGAQKFYEDDLVIALCTHKPIFPGHCLIIPKRHVKYFEELSSDEATQITQVIKKVHEAVQDTFHTSSYLLLQKNGEEVGQTVPHVHFHYIPRKTGETSTLAFLLKMYVANAKKPIAPQEMQEIVCKLKQSIL